MLAGTVPAEKTCEQRRQAPKRKHQMNRYQPNDDAQEPNPIGIGAWVLIPIGLFLIGFVLLFQYGLDFFLGQDNDNQPEAADEPTVHTTQAGSQQETLQNSIGMSLTLIPTGELSPQSGNVSRPQDELKQRRIPHSFFMGTCEVTNKQYYAVMRSAQHRYKPANLPATKVTWTDAVAFCQRLSAIAAEQQRGYVYRLPTELEWEYACRAGTRTAFSFPGSNVKLAAYGWFASNANGTAHAVATRKANPWGLFDMHGNVWEWCADPFQLTATMNSDTLRRANDELRVRRGGGWLSLADHCRSDVRRGLAANRTLADVGFRVVMSRTHTPADVATTDNRAQSPDENRTLITEIPPEPPVATVQAASTRAASTPSIAGKITTAPDSRVATAQTPTPPRSQPRLPKPVIVKRSDPQDRSPGARIPQPTRPKKTTSRDYLINAIGITMRRIAPGVWTATAPQRDKADSHKHDARTLRVDQPFHIAIHEVTQEQFQLIMGTNPSRFRNPDHPVETVDWYAAESFCKKLSALDEEIAAGRSYRLPTEAEWEYSCRAAESRDPAPPANQNRLNLNFWCANNSGEQEFDAAQFFQEAPQHYPDQLLANGCKTHPVGQKRPNRWSLFDMQGNVWEWCGDIPSNHSNANRGEKTSVNVESQRIIRGGSWYDVPALCQPASRTKLAPAEQYDNVGFRVVCDQTANPPR